jgi:hypothetical protein
MGFTLALGFGAASVAAAACALVLGLSSASAAGSGTAARRGVVLVERGGGIAAVNVDGSGVHQLTAAGHFGDDLDPVASPDGAQIAFDRAFARIRVVQKGCVVVNSGLKWGGVEDAIRRIRAHDR